MNWTGLFTLIKRENVRSIKILNQVIWPPIISSLLYVLIFGFSIGKDLSIEGTPYLFFLVPGLIMMNIIMSSYDESASSLFLAKFIKYIEELLVAPLSYLELVLGLMIGSITRAFIIANLIFILFIFLIGSTIANIGLYLYFMLIVSAFFACVGLIIALWAEKFDHLAVLNTFFITPLLFFGGVFHSINLLPPLFKKISLFNPLFYMIDGFRFAILGTSDMNITVSLVVTTSLAVFAFISALHLFKKGYKLKT